MRRVGRRLRPLRACVWAPGSGDVHMRHRALQGAARWGHPHGAQISAQALTEPHHKRHAHLLIKEARRVPAHPMLTHRLTVIGGHQDEGLIQDPPRAQPLQERLER